MKIRHIKPSAQVFPLVYIKASCLCVLKMQFSSYIHYLHIGSISFMMFLFTTSTDLKAAQIQSIVQYILIRGDLFRELNWSSGAVIAQACHASTACIATYLKQNDIHTEQYIEDLENMHKVVLDVINEKEILNASKVLTEHNILHTMWYEKPENIPTCIAVKPYPRNDLKKYLRKYKLFNHPIMPSSSKE